MTVAFYGSYTHIISLIWNQLPSVVKNAHTVSSFPRHLNKFNILLAVNALTTFDVTLLIYTDSMAILTY